MERIFFFSVTLGVLLFSVPGVFAQSLDRDSFKPNYKYGTEEAAKPVYAPRVFSSRLTEEKPAQALDRLYYTLSVALRGYALVDATHQERLMELMEPYRFETTRYPAEFKPDMDDAMEDLNKNYKKMQEEIAKADKAFAAIRSDFSPENREAVDTLWEEQKKVFADRSNAYFSLQHDFLLTYKGLVDFILKRPGTYYYNTGTRKMTFNNIGAYRYFGKSVDNLRLIIRKKLDFFENDSLFSAEEDTAP